MNDKSVEEEKRKNEKIIVCTKADLCRLIRFEEASGLRLYKNKTRKLTFREWIENMPLISLTYNNAVACN